MKRFIVKGITIAILVAALAFFAATPAFAANPPGGPGQPNQSCQAQPSGPPGFDTSGFANAETHYAGSQPQNSNNPNSVAQYDVACFEVSQPPP